MLRSSSLFIKLTVSLLILAFATLARPSHAAEMICLVKINPPTPATTETSLEWLARQAQPPPPSCSSILIKGTIERGDYEQFLTLFRQTQRGEPVYLQSSGGVAEEAMKIGRLLRKYLVPVEAPSVYGGTSTLKSFQKKVEEVCKGPTCMCASACALIWLGSVDRRGTVGLHRPKITDPEFGALPLAEARNIYNQVLHQVTSYLQEMEVPATVIDTMVATSSADIHWVSYHQNGYRLRHPPSFVEWVTTRCGPPLTVQEEKTLNDLDLKNTLQRKYSFQSLKMTTAETALHDRLGQQGSDYDVCRMMLVADEVLGLPPP